MIKLSDTTLLAFTKLRTRKIRTIITVLLASLLFGVLVAFSLVITGAFSSIDRFRSGGLTSRYIVGVNKAFSASDMQKTLRNPGLIAKAKERYEQLVEEKTKEAERLGLTYTQASDQPPYMESSSDASKELLSINDPNGIVYELLAEKFSTQPAFDDARLKTLADQYSATDIFASENYTVLRGSSLITLQDGKEVFYDQSDEAEVNANYVRPLVDGNQMTISPPEITDPFMLPNKASWKPESGALPIILPQNIIEQLLGLEKLPDNLSSKEKLNRLKTVRNQAMSLTFRACYRDSASLALIQQTIQQQEAIAAGANDKDYRKPALIFTLPDPTGCKNPTVASDTRSADKKRQDEAQKVFDEKFGKDTVPSSYFVTFKVVGVSPAESVQSSENNSPAGQSRNMSDIMNNLLKTSGIGQTIPGKLYEQIPVKKKYSNLFTYKPLYLFGNEDNKMRYIEFARVQDARKFIDEQSCAMQYDNTCKPLGRPYQAVLSFSNSAALDDMRSTASQWFKYATIGVIVLAAAVMWITVSRTIADGRRETAVFRAIGFKRVDIAMIYVLYTLILSIMVAVFAGIIGVSAAYIANQQFASQLTVQAQYGFGGMDLSKEVTLIGINQQQLSLLLAACLATGLLSMILPLLRNLHRSPIRDMREE